MPNNEWVRDCFVDVLATFQALTRPVSVFKANLVASAEGDGALERLKIRGSMWTKGTNAVHTTNYTKDASSESHDRYRLRIGGIVERYELEACSARSWD